MSEGKIKLPILIVRNNNADFPRPAEVAATWEYLEQKTPFSPAIEYVNDPAPLYFTKIFDSNNNSSTVTNEETKARIAANYLAQKKNCIVIVLYSSMTLGPSAVTDFFCLRNGAVWIECNVKWWQRENDTIRNITHEIVMHALWKLQEVYAGEIIPWETYTPNEIREGGMHYFKDDELFALDGNREWSLSLLNTLGWDAVIAEIKKRNDAKFSYVFKKNLSFGDASSYEVNMLQKALQYLKYMPVVALGPYGPQTKIAVAKLQKKYNIADPDGEGSNFGPQSRAVLNQELKQ